MSFFVSEGRKAHYRAAGIGLACVVSAACSVYDPTLLEARRDAVENGGTAGAELGANGGQADAGGGVGALGGTDATGGTSGTVAGDTGSGGVSGSTSGDSGGAAGRSGSAGTSAAGAGQSGSGGSSNCSGDCQVLKTALKHRYSFNGTGTTITDSVGKAPGKAVNATLSGSGTLSLAGGTSDTYVDLPNGIISSLTDATFEVWLTWNGGDPWQRIFDFGNSIQGEDTQSGGVTYFFLAPSSAWGPQLRTAYSLGGIPGESAVQSSSGLPVGSSEHVTVIFDDTHNQVSLYIDGAFNTGVGLDAHLSSLQDVNNWLGRSQFADPALSATLDEFRIYGAALTADQILLSHESGPNPSFLP